jgi:mycothiol synthase
LSTSFDVWGREQAGDLAGLAALALPDEQLSGDELLACCWDPGDGVVLGTPDGSGAAALAVRGSTAVVLLLAVAPEAEGAGLGRSLLDAACARAWDAGAERVVLGGLAPYYLWPGVDVRFTRMLGLAESAGFRETGAALNLACPTAFRQAAPEGVTVRRALEPGDVATAVAFCDERFPQWVPELVRATEQGCCHVATDDATAEVLGFAAHSVNRAGWFGPTGVSPAARGRGVGGALLAACCRDLQIAEFRECEIAWIGPVAFYAKTAGASVSRVFRTAALPKP